MKTSKVIYKHAWPYQQDKMNLPVENVDTAINFYETVMGFRKISNVDTPYKSAVLKRDDVEIGLAENGGDPTQDGCFFEVNNVEDTLDELKANGFNKIDSDFSFQKHGSTLWRVFFIIAPDGLCYCIGERQS
ncbi:VOC family protein [Emticicia sp. BO119]|uniref:VOC family protein n=1 Tax=Emticicia sp. BO119 TaxID=2757768 RepID=UPI0015F116E9|nr:VOC family protein [Emticicia sp. BO119]MBA4849311.1 VOC family protein [Emticicia sp. BO119]